MSRANNSILWGYFEKTNTGDKKATCKECGDLYSYKASTGNLKSHLKKIHPDAYRHVNAVQLQNAAAAAARLPEVSPPGTYTSAQSRSDAAVPETKPIEFQDVVPKTEEKYSNDKSVEKPRRKRSKPVIHSVYTTSTPNNHTPPQRTEHTASIFKTKDDKMNEMDECELYGHLLARKLRKLDERQRDLAMHEIDNIMFRAKMNTDESQAKRTKSPVFVLTQNEEQYDEEYLEDPIHDES